MDINGDKIPDILSGSYPGELYYFPAKGDGFFGERKTIKNSTGADLNVGQAAAPCAFDWDGDGDLDLIVGSIDGKVFYIPNLGSTANPQYRQAAGQFHTGKLYSDPESIIANGKPVTTESDAAPTVADWNGDGIPDLIVGSGDGSVTLYLATCRNQDKTPRLGPPTILLPTGVSSPNHPWGIRTKPFVCDYNHDGKLDLLVGDFHSDSTGYHGYVWLFLRKSK